MEVDDCLVGFIVFYLIFVLPIVAGDNYRIITFLIWALELVILLGYVKVVEAIDKKKNEKQRRQEEEQRRKAAEVRQQGYHKQMIVLGDKSLGLFESMPKYLTSAEEYLNQAEIDFADGAFAPFWDSIEVAANQLSHFYNCARRINENLSNYGDLIKKYEHTPPEFPLASQSIAKLEVGKTTAERMQVIVRKAQCNFQFATIYEQRKTNQILVAGFTNLAQALREMTWRITDSIDALTRSVDGMTSTLEESRRGIYSRMGDIAKETRQHHKQVSKEVSERRAREEKAIEILDNIQRRRRPFP